MNKPLFGVPPSLDSPSWLLAIMILIFQRRSYPPNVVYFYSDSSMEMQHAYSAMILKEGIVSLVTQHFAYKMRMLVNIFIHVLFKL